uniref:Fibrinogen C-terminal domain-containing protein n=1 Tax=Anopheles culicifacies TaxID=139723 RepID=A0A182MVV9_9DIPT
MMYERTMMLLLLLRVLCGRCSASDWDDLTLAVQTARNPAIPARFVIQPRNGQYIHTNRSSMWFNAALLLVCAIQGAVATTCDFPQSLCFDSEPALTNLDQLEAAIRGLGTVPADFVKPEDLNALIAQITDKIKESGEFAPSSYESCSDLPAGSPSGLYKLRGEFSTPQTAYCDQDYEGSGWLVFQRRFNGMTDFYRTWNEYQNGFGDIASGEFWWGLKNLYRTTNLAPHELLIVLKDFDGMETVAYYSAFQIGDESEQYRMNVLGEYVGTAGDSLRRHLNMAFTTKDRDNDNFGLNCAEQNTGAWWYASCLDSNLNGQYLNGPTALYAKGMSWKTFRDLGYSLKSSVMMIRRRSHHPPFQTLAQFTVAAESVSRSNVENVFPTLVLIEFPVVPVKPSSVLSRKLSASAAILKLVYRTVAVAPSKASIRIASSCWDDDVMRLSRVNPIQNSCSGWPNPSRYSLKLRVKLV